MGGAIRVTGLRYVYWVHTIAYDIFGDTQREERKEMEKAIKDLINDTNKLQHGTKQFNTDSEQLSKLKTLESDLKNNVIKSLELLSVYQNISQSEILQKLTPSIKEFIISDFLSQNQTKN